MVKIRVTGEMTFDWIGAKYDATFASDCSLQSTFSEGCFQGTDVTEENFNVMLSAITQGKNNACFICIDILIINSDPY